MPSETDVAPIPFHDNPLMFCAEAKAVSLIFSFYLSPFLHCSASLVTHLNTHILSQGWSNLPSMPLRILRPWQSTVFPSVCYGHHPPIPFLSVPPPAHSWETQPRAQMDRRRQLVWSALNQPSGGLQIVDNILMFGAQQETFCLLLSVYRPNGLAMPSLVMNMGQK